MVGEGCVQVSSTKDSEATRAHTSGETTSEGDDPRWRVSIACCGEDRFEDGRLEPYRTLPVLDLDLTHGQREG